MIAMARTRARTAKRWQDADEMRWAVRHWAARIDVKVPLVLCHT